MHSCPECGDRISGVDFQDGEEVLEPCGHEAPEHFRTAVSKPVRTDGAGQLDNGDQFEELRSADAKYAHMLGDDETTVDESQSDTTDISEQIVVVRHEKERQTLRFRAHVSIGSSRWEPVCTHAERFHRVVGSSQFKRSGEVDWVDLPVPVQQEIAETVPDVADPSDLDPEIRFVHPQDGDRV